MITRFVILLIFTILVGLYAGIIVQANGDYFDGSFLGMLFLFLTGLGATFYTLFNYKRISLKEEILTVYYLFKPSEQLPLVKLEEWKEIRYYIRRKLKRSLILFFPSRPRLIISNVDFLDEFRKLSTLLLDKFGHLDTSPERRVQVNHLFDRPASQIFKAWSDAKLLAAWWCPNETATAIIEHDLRPHGNWRLSVHSIGGNGLLHFLFTQVEQNKTVSWIDVYSPEIKYTFRLNSKDTLGTEICYEVVFASIEEGQQKASLYRREMREAIHRLEAEINRAFAN